MGTDVQYIFLPAGAETKFRILHGIDRPINEMTVGQICENCHVSRPTFYAHFDSKYAIPFWLFDFAFDLYLAEIGRSVSWDEGIHGFLSLLYREKDYLPFAFIDNPSRNEVESRLQKRRDSMLATMKEYKGIDPDDELLYFIDHFVYYGNQMVATWCIEGMQVDPATFARWFTACMPDRLIRLLDKGLHATS